MSYHSKLKTDLQGAAAAGLITPEQADKVWERSYSMRTFASFKAAHWIGAAAGLFVALGLILVVASNWDKIGAIAKMGAFLLLFYGIGEAVLRLESKPAAAIPLETLWFFMPVLGIGLYAQIFNLSGDPVKPYLVWAALSAPLAVFSKRPLAAYLCAILLFTVLYWGTMGSANMLSLTARYNSGSQPLWHWALALGVLGAGVAVYPGKKTGLPLGASAVWLFLMLVTDTALKLRSSALILLAGMSLHACRSMSAGAPPKCTTTIARVQGVIEASTASGDRQRFALSTSAKTGVAPLNATAWTVDANVRGGTMTSSPGDSVNAANARCNAAVHELVATTCVAPRNEPNSCSNAAVSGPDAVQPRRRTRAVASASRSSYSGRKTGMTLDTSISLSLSRTCVSSMTSAGQTSWLFLNTSDWPPASKPKTPRAFCVVPGWCTDFFAMRTHAQPSRIASKPAWVSP